MATIQQESSRQGLARPTPSRFLALMGAAGLALVVLALARHGPRRASGEDPMDFAQYYFTGWQLRHGLPVYGQITFGGDLARAVGREYANPQRTGNPPALICLTWPIALVPFPVAWWGLAVGSLVVLATASWIAARNSGWDRRGAAAWAALAAGSAPTLTFVILNHIEAPIALLGVCGWLCLRGGRANLARLRGFGI